MSRWRSAAGRISRAVRGGPLVTDRDPDVLRLAADSSVSMVRKVAGFALVLVMSPVVLAAIAGAPPKTAGGPSEVARTEIPADLLSVYIAASYTCTGLPWQVLAAIGFVESGHANSRADPATGEVDPPILGPAIDGRRGFAAIPDPSSVDGWAHAVGPMQFLTTTFRDWAVVAPDRPPDAVPDPNNAWDAIYSAANYLCGGADRLDDLRSAVLRYNRSERYYEVVLAKAATYGFGAGLPSGGALANGSGEAVVLVAMTQLGAPYVWGGDNPAAGFDCSGLVQWAYAQVGVHLPRTTQQQVTVGIAITLEQLRPGDLVFSRSVRDGGSIVDRGHLSIYAGAGHVVVAPKSGEVVSVRPLRPEAVQAIRRVVGTTP